jgi:hypothetical protein
MKTVEQLLKNTFPPSHGCMEWRGAYNSDGYPRIAWNGNSNGKVHRIIYELTTGENISGLVVRHTCDNPRCINPKHLLKGTPKDNANDRDERKRTYHKITPEIVQGTLDLLKQKLKHKEIAGIIKIDPRRVSDINCGKYDLRARFLGSGGL